MSIPRRRGDREPVLTRPHVVRLVGRAAPAHPIRRRSPIVPTWRVRVLVDAAGRLALAQETDTGESIEYALDVLVIPPDGWRDLTIGYVCAGERIRCAATWAPVFPVAPADHDPAAGRFALDLSPTIRFEEARRVPE